MLTRSPYGLNYNYYKPRFYATSGRAYAEFRWNPQILVNQWDETTYVFDHNEELQHLVIGINEKAAITPGVVTARQFYFGVTGDVPPVGYFLVNLTPVTTVEQFVAAFMASIDANTNFLVQPLGTLGFRLVQPFPGRIQFGSDIGDHITFFGLNSQGIDPPEGSLTPSGLYINGLYAPERVSISPTATAIAEATFTTVVAGYSAAAFAARALVVPKYEALQDSNPATGFPTRLRDRVVHFVAGAPPPNTVFDYYISTTDISTAQLLSTALETAFLYFDFTVTRTSSLIITVFQPWKGPGGNALIDASTPALANLLINGGAALGTDQWFENGFGRSQFILPTGLYGNTAIPLRFGKRFAFLPTQAPPLELPPEPIQ